MSKHIKNEISAIKNIILKYGVKIPSNNIAKFEKDLKMIFNELFNYRNHSLDSFIMWLTLRYWTR